MRHLLVIAALAAAPVAAAAAQAPAYKRDIPDSLAAAAKLTEARAAAVAQRRVPRGHIQAVELEREDGRLIYSYEFKVPGRSGTQEVNVNAKTGRVVNVEHESARSEAREAAAEKKEGTSKKPKKP